MNVIIYYDGDCPFCARYVRYTRLQATVGAPRLVNVRVDTASLEKLEAAGYDLDRGMVVEMDGRRYAGSEAMHALALLSTRSGTFNRLMVLLFSSRVAAFLLYPLLRAGRNLVLLALGRPGVRIDAGAPLLDLFAAFWGMFAVLHFLVYLFDFGQQAWPTTYAIPLLGLWLLFHPRSRLVLLVLLGVMLADAWLHMPLQSNHTIMKNFFLLAVLLGGMYFALRGRSLESLFQAVAPVGRALLLVMYVFGVFHKINSGFLDPQASCAMTLWREMPLPLSMLDGPWIARLAIYGTLVIESLIFLFLLVPGLRHIGIVTGIGFHMLLALSNYALYSAFSALSMVLHVLFLTPEAAARIQNDPLWLKAMAKSRTFAGRLAIAAYLLLLVVASYAGAFQLVAAFWFLVAIPLLVLVARHGRDARDTRTWGIVLTRPIWLNAISLAFFLNCITPYMGLKTAQSINKFANLRLEGGVSNHLVMRHAPRPFTYLEDLVRVTDVSGVAYLYYIKSQDLRITYYELLNHLERNPGARVSYERNGTKYDRQSSATLAEDIDRMLHPRWFRKWFHFMPVDVSEPKACARDR